MDNDEEKNRRQEFDQGIPPGNGRLTESAFPLEQQETDNRNVVPRFERMIAVWAMGTGKDDRSSLWNTEDAHIKKTSE
jgi:hypothetical protein